MRGAPTNSIDVVLIAPRGRRLAVLLVRDESKHAREKWCLPWAPADGGEPLDHLAARAAQRAAGVKPRWIGQAGAFAGGTRHPGGAELSVGFVAVTPEPGVPLNARTKWFAAGDLPHLAPRHREIAGAAFPCLRERMDR